MTQNQDIHSNRKSQKYTRRELFRRLVWAFVQPFFSYSPRQLWGWRNFLLRVLGAKIGWHVNIYPTVNVHMPWHLTIGDYAAIGDNVILYALGPIQIGPRSTISQNAHLCAGSHDYRDPSMPLTKPPIHIGADAWVCSDAFVGPDVTIGDRAIVAARSVVIKNVEANTIVGGNPAKFLRFRPPFSPAKA